MTSDSAKPIATASFRCALCHGLAGTIELLPPGHPEGFSKETATLFLHDFLGTEKWALSGQGSPALQAALNQSDAAALHQVESLWAPFYCPACNCVYCYDHWVIVPQYDEGYFDCSYGTCPQGHRRLTED